MGWLCCSSKIKVIESKIPSRKSIAASLKSSKQSIPNLKQQFLPPVLNKLPPYKQIEPFIPESSPPRIEFNIRESNLPLVDTEEILELLHKILQTNREEGTPTILAQADRRLGNVSKSDTVRKYIKNYGSEYDYILWIDAENRTTMQNCFYTLSIVLNNKLFDEDGKSYKPTQKLAKEIFRVLTKRHCLIVYDGVDDKSVFDPMTGIVEFLPQKFQGQVKPSIIITSKKSKWDNPELPVGLELATLSEERCIEYLLTSMKAENNSENRATAAKICQGTGRLPLLLKLSVAIMEQETMQNEALNKTPLQDFLSEYNTIKRRYLPLRMNNALADSRYFVLVHLAMSKVLQHPDKKAREIARKCSQLMMYFKNIKIPKQLFTLFFPFESPLVLAEGLQLLNNYCVVTDCGDYFEMHPMVQKAFLDVGKVNNWESETIRNEIQILTNYLTSMPTEEKFYREILACAVQVEEYIQHDYSNTFNLDFAKFVVSKIKDIYFEKAYEISERIFQFELTALGSTHRDTLNSKQTMADALCKLQRYEEAEKVYTQIYICRQEIGGKASREALMTAYSLAFVYSKQGRFQDALELYSESDLIAGKRKSNVMLDLMSILFKHCEIAKLHLKVGEYAQALALATDVVDQRLRMEGLDTEDTLKARYIKGCALSGLKRWVDADKELRIVVKLGTEMFGKAHPLVLIASRDLAKVKIQWGKVQEGYKIYVELLEVQLKNFTLDHETTIGIMSELTGVLESMRKFNMALLMKMQALNFAYAVLPETHALRTNCEADVAAMFIKILPI